HDGAMVLENRRALPRAWLVAKAEAVGDEEALRRIRGESAQPFDPRRTALLEIEPGAHPTLSALPGGDVSANARAQVVSHEPNRLVIETHADHPSVLVVSEINHPGWKAVVDGVKTPIHQTDYLLRGVILPAGSHRVEMNYAPLTARIGAFISAGALALILALAGYARHTRYRKESDEMEAVKTNE
ncbi:MAG: YfhO family protein, partial [Blastocatellia bacterium]